MSSIDSMIPTKCIVQRDGKSLEISAQSVVVGDVCFLQSGMKTPADLRLVEVSALEIDMSMLTGEQKPLKMTTVEADSKVSMLQATNIAFMGCNVVGGEGKGVVVATGAQTQLSKIAEQVSNAVPITGLQRDLNVFVVKIGAMAGVTMVVVALVWALYLRVQHPGFMQTSAFIANTIAVVVAFIPEGLPLAMSMGLSIIASRLCKEHKVRFECIGRIERFLLLYLIFSN